MLGKSHEVELAAVMWDSEGTCDDLFMRIAERLGLPIDVSHTLREVVFSSLTALLKADYERVVGREKTKQMKTVDHVYISIYMLDFMRLNLSIANNVSCICHGQS